MWFSISTSVGFKKFPGLQLPSVNIGRFPFINSILALFLYSIFCSFREDRTKLRAIR